MQPTTTKIDEAKNKQEQFKRNAALKTIKKENINNKETFKRKINPAILYM